MLLLNAVAITDREIQKGYPQVQADHVQQVGPGGNRMAGATFEAH